MCTITYLPFSSGGHVLTQNRDVGPGRVRAIPPEEHSYKGKILTYPVDPQGGGTWNAFSGHRQACILNGAGYDYYPDFDAPKSRGSLCLDVLTEGPEFLYEEDLTLYDHFTLLYFSHDKKGEIIEFRWNGKDLLEKRRNGAQPHIWISRGLYSYPDFLRKRKDFDHFLEVYGDLPSKDLVEKLWDFHLKREVAGEEGYLIDRPGMVKTVSIFQTLFLDGTVELRYEDQ